MAAAAVSDTHLEGAASHRTAFKVFLNTDVTLGLSDQECYALKVYISTFCI